MKPLRLPLPLRFVGVEFPRTSRKAPRIKDNWFPPDVGRAPDSACLPPSQVAYGHHGSAPLRYGSPLRFDQPRRSRALASRAPFGGALSGSPHSRRLGGTGCLRRKRVRAGWEAEPRSLSDRGENPLGDSMQGRQAHFSSRFRASFYPLATPLPRDAPGRLASPHNAFWPCLRSPITPERKALALGVSGE